MTDDVRELLVEQLRCLRYQPGLWIVLVDGEPAGPARDDERPIVRRYTAKGKNSKSPTDAIDELQGGIPFGPSNQEGTNGQICRRQRETEIFVDRISGIASGTFTIRNVMWA